jgi:hypothetical protein
MNAWRAAHSGPGVTILVGVVMAAAYFSGVMSLPRALASGVAISILQMLGRRAQRNRAQSRP